MLRVPLFTAEALLRNHGAVAFSCFLLDHLCGLFSKFACATDVTNSVIGNTAHFYESSLVAILVVWHVRPHVFFPCDRMVARDVTGGVDG